MRALVSLRVAGMGGLERRLTVVNWCPTMASSLPDDILKDVSPEEKSSEAPVRKPHPAAVAAAAAAGTPSTKGLPCELV